VVSSGTESASVGKGGNEETRTVVDVAIRRFLVFDDDNAKEMMMDAAGESGLWS
jgi:hypothetical protein